MILRNHFSRIAYKFLWFFAKLSYVKYSYTCYDKTAYSYHSEGETYHEISMIICMFICLEHKKITHILIKKDHAVNKCLYSFLGEKSSKYFFCSQQHMVSISLESLENTDKYSKVISFWIGDSFFPSFSIVFMSFILQLFLVCDSLNTNSYTDFTYKHTLIEDVI